MKGWMVLMGSSPIAPSEELYAYRGVCPFYFWGNFRASNNAQQYVKWKPELKNHNENCHLLGPSTMTVQSNDARWVYFNP